MLVPPVARLAQIRRVALAILVAAAVLLMCVIGAGAMNGADPSMSSMSGMTTAVGEPAVGGPLDLRSASDFPSPTGSALSCAGDCASGLAQACVVAFAVAVALLAAARSLRRIDEDLASGVHVVLAGFAMLTAVRPWSVLTLSQLSLLRV